MFKRWLSCLPVLLSVFVSTVECAGVADQVDSFRGAVCTRRQL